LTPDLNDAGLTGLPAEGTIPPFQKSSGNISKKAFLTTRDAGSFSRDATRLKKLRSWDSFTEHAIAIE
jgi:hypothetical protein